MLTLRRQIRKKTIFKKFQHQYIMQKKYAIKHVIPVIDITWQKRKVKKFKFTLLNLNKKFNALGLIKVKEVRSRTKIQDMRFVSNLQTANITTVNKSEFHYRTLSFLLQTSFIASTKGLRYIVIGLVMKSLYTQINKPKENQQNIRNNMLSRATTDKDNPELAPNVTYERYKVLRTKGGSVIYCLSKDAEQHCQHN